MKSVETKLEGPVARLIQARRTIRSFKSDPVSRSLLLELLNVAVWAPNHLNRQPWRFILFQDEGRTTFANAMVQTYSAEDKEKYGKKKLEYYKAVPAHLIVVMKEDPRQKVWDEDYAAVCSLIQNFQLAAWEQGLGVVWKTNHFGYDPRFRNDVGVQAGEKIVGILHIGYPDIVPPVQLRTPAEELLTVIEE
ncbi:nitroreductase family protein [Paenibacillus sp. S-38]|uniref:nitroreductase family protein n=1 Tax=Paenibacillus sp. S-38 TaxID=3416710 RepID=UPI003CEA5626